MGFNTSVLVLNDAIGDIEKDTDFGRRLADAIRQLSVEMPPVGGIHVPGGAKVIETHHNDGMSVVMMGGNCGTVLGHASMGTAFTKDEQIKVLRELAQQFGFWLVKK